MVSKVIESPVRQKSSLLLLTQFKSLSWGATGFKEDLVPYWVLTRRFTCKSLLNVAPLQAQLLTVNIITNFNESNGSCIYVCALRSN